MAPPDSLIESHHRRRSAELAGMYGVVPAVWSLLSHSLHRCAPQFQTFNRICTEPLGSGMHCPSSKDLPDISILGSLQLLKRGAQLIPLTDTE